MKKNPRKVRWTGAFRRTHGKELLVDSTFEFERKQNRPVRYDRNLYLATIKAMKRIQQIRLRRERMFYRKRIHDEKEKLNRRIKNKRERVKQRERLSALKQEERMKVLSEPAKAKIKTKRVAEEKVKVAPAKERIQESIDKEEK